ncbi:MAG: sigma 54-interacting transcriptional regulator [Verrucomicrobia subdivision 3 bacterium]|nr:sigma 54-interacting transcriptional regulator [Limisphaerales bacterium]
MPSDAEAAALRLVVEGTASETGTAFFRALVRNLATVMGTVGAWVTEYLPAEKRLRALGFWLNGAFVESFEYATAGTACAPVVESKKLIHIPDRLIELYPGDPTLAAWHAVSYLGVPLLDPQGEVIGHLSVLDNKPLPADPRLISLFEIFAARAAAELRRLKTEQQVRAREEELTALLESAMDAILVLDHEMKIVRVNAAAARLFGCTREDLMRESIKDFLVAESVARVEGFAKELGARPEGRQQLWVSQDFIARRWDHSVFPAEGTLSRFENRDEAFYTLILRNSDERLEAERQIQLLTQETEYLREAVREVPGHDDLLGRSDVMQAVFEAIKRVAKTDSTVLITGETGTGKELIARSIHRASNRADKPLVLVNCAAVPANLMESEFFGHERGAFTGAVSRREGRFALANGGTIFLDEVGELPLELQAKLLRVLQEGEFEPLGSAKTVKVNVRVVAATNRDLKRMSGEGKFREDLYFRLHVFPIHIPALRERGRDIEHLAAAFIQRFARRMGKRVNPLTEDQLKRLRSYAWPGNVRELQNVIERAIILTSGNRLELERAMSGIAAPAESASAALADSAGETGRVLTAREMQKFERRNIMLALETCGGKIAGENGAARLLGIPATTLNSRIKALGIERTKA